MRQSFAILITGFLMSGCSTASYLNTPKNPKPVFVSTPQSKNETLPKNVIEAPLIGVLGEAMEINEDRSITLRSTTEVKDINRYMTAGFALTDHYCNQFFRQTDESYRRRRFGRTLTNDVGTAIGTVLGLANAGENVVTGIATGFGLADSGWRNFEDAFLIAPDLENVRALVMAAQDDFRSETFSLSRKHSDYAQAQSTIMRYAEICSFLGMKALLNQAADEQRRQLQKNAEQNGEQKTKDKTEKKVPSSVQKTDSLNFQEFEKYVPAARVGAIPTISEQK